MRHRKLIWIVALAFVVAVCIHLWGRDMPEARPKKSPNMPLFSVLFQGYSNSLSGEKWAILVITNRDVCTLDLLVPVRVRFLEHPEQEARQILFDGTPLPRRSSCRVAIQIPAASGAWKFYCRITRDTWQEELRGRLPDWLDHCIPGSSTAPAMAYVDTGWIPQ